MRFVPPKIFDSYMRTSMARSSGAVSVGAFRESFEKASSLMFRRESITACIVTPTILCSSSLL